MRKIIRTVFCHCFVGGLFAKKNNDQLRYLLRHSTEAPKIIAKQTSGTCCQKVFCSYTITPDLAPKDFHLFRYLKRSLGGKRFSDYEEKKVAVNSWLSDKAAEFFDEGFQNLALRTPCGWSAASHDFSPSPNLTRRLAARRLFRILPCREGTIHLQISMPSLVLEPGPYGTAVSINNHHTGWGQV
ncbi:hypothetical protein TNCV_3327811 [Trichonephila clavipes]|nr:hypothetical protein TNCV_3327811 [Trichonephila clavipes]